MILTLFVFAKRCKRSIFNLTGINYFDFLISQKIWKPLHKKNVNVLERKLAKIPKRMSKFCGKNSQFIHKYAKIFTKYVDKLEICADNFWSKHTREPKNMFFVLFIEQIFQKNYVHSVSGEFRATVGVLFTQWNFLLAPIQNTRFYKIYKNLKRHRSKEIPVEKSVGCTQMDALKKAKYRKIFSPTSTAKPTSLQIMVGFFWLLIVI